MMPTSWYGHPLAWLGLTIAVTALALGLYALWRWRTPGAPVFAASMFVVVVWALAYLFQIASPSAEAAFFWLSLHMIGPIVLPPVWLVLVCHQTGHAHRLNWGVLTALAAIPLVSVTLLHLVPWPNPMVADVSMETVGALSLLRVTPGFWYWVHTGYSYGIVLVTVLLLLTQIIHLPRRLRRPPALILGGFVALMVFHVWTQSMLTGLRPNPGTLVSALAFLVLTFGIYRYRLLELLPLARAQVMDVMEDCVIILDARQRIVDVNRAALAILNLPADNLLGAYASDCLSAWPDLCGPEVAPNLLSVGEGPQVRHYAVQPLPLLNAEGRCAGQILVLRDVTKAEQAQREQQRLIGELRTTLAMLRDAHGMLPVCAWCGKVRDGQDRWISLSEWLDVHGVLELTHGVCPACEDRILNSL